MHQDQARKAFTFGSVLGRKDTLRITCLAVDSDSQRLFLGLSNGQVEEHQLQQSASGGLPTCRLLSERRISRHAEVADLCCLPVALCLVVRTDDGAVYLAAYETSAIHQLPSTKGSHASIIAGDAMRAPARLAVVLRSSSVLSKAARATQISTDRPTHSSKILVYAVASGPGGISHSGQPAHLLARVTIPEPVLDLAWVKDGILAAVPGSYLLILSGCKVVEVAPGVTNRTLLSACPPMGQAVMLFSDSLLLLVDSQGAAIREPVLLPDSPVAVALTPSFVVAVTDEAILVYDSTTSQLVQQVAFAHDDAWVVASSRLPCVQDFKSGALLLATSTAVMYLQPVELEQQVWELLKQHRFHQALLLTQSALASRQLWAGPAMAQAGLMLLRAMHVSEAMEAFAACPEDAWQPAYLLPLFPSVTARWLADAPQAKTYWGLHGPGPLQSLTHICNHYLDVHKAKHPQQQQPDADALVTDAKAHIATYILKVRKRPGVQCLEALDTLAVALLSESGQAGLLEAFLSSGPAAAAAAAVGAAFAGDRSSSPADPTPFGSTIPLSSPAPSQTGAMWSQDGASVGTGWAHEGADESPGTSFGGMDVGRRGLGGPGSRQLAVTAAEAAASALQLPCSAALRESVRALEVDRRWHSLALLRAARNHVDEALEVWQGLSEGRLQEAECSSGAVACFGTATPVAVASAGAVLLDQKLVPTALLLQQLPWLLLQGPSQALTLLRCRTDVSVEAALALLDRHTGDVRWGYLQHLVYDRAVSESALHTELALELVECIQRQVQAETGASSSSETGTVDVSSGGMPGQVGTQRADAGLQNMDVCLSALEVYFHRQQQRDAPKPSTLLVEQQGGRPPAGSTEGKHQGVSPCNWDPVQMLLAAVPQQQFVNGLQSAGCSGMLASQVPHLLQLRAVFLLHLHRSALYDPAVVLAALGPLPLMQPSTASQADETVQQGSAQSSGQNGAQGNTPPHPDCGHLLLRERVLLLSRLEDHAAALALLAFRMGDLDACISYCRQHTASHLQRAPSLGGPDAQYAADGAEFNMSTMQTPWLTLLGLLLEPGQGHEPMYAAAVRVLHEEGGNLSPLQVLAALPDSMPLNVAVQQLTSMLAGVMHRRRHTQVIKGLHRAQNLTCRSELSQLSRQRVVITEDSACHGCHRLLLDKVVFRYPSGMLLCARCVKP